MSRLPPFGGTFDYLLLLALVFMPAALLSADPPAAGDVYREVPLHFEEPSRLQDHRFGPDGQLYLLHSEYHLHVWIALMRYLPEMLALLWLVLAVWVGRRMWRTIKRSRQTRGEPHCPRCGYQLTALHSRQCPECGCSFDERQPEISRGLPKRRLAGLAAIPMLALLIIGVYLGTYGRYGPPYYWLPGWRSQSLARLVEDYQLTWLYHAISSTSVISRVDPLTDTQPTRVGQIPFAHAYWFYFSEQDDQRLYLGDRGGGIHAFTLTDGHTAWSLPGYAKDWDRATNFFPSEDETEVHYIDVDGQLWSSDTAAAGGRAEGSWHRTGVTVDLPVPLALHQGWVPPDERAFANVIEPGGIVVAHAYRQFRYYDAETGHTVRKFSFAHGEAIYWDSPLDHPERMHAITQDQATPPTTRIEVWDTERAESLAMFSPPEDHHPRSLALSPDARRLYLLTQTHGAFQINIRDETTGTWAGQLTFPHDLDQIWDGQINEAGDTLVSMGWRSGSDQLVLLVHRLAGPAREKEGDGASSATNETR